MGDGGVVVVRAGNVVVHVVQVWSGMRGVGGVCEMCMLGAAWERGVGG